jgi:hypothetical protein
MICFIVNLLYYSNEMFTQNIVKSCLILQLPDRGSAGSDSRKKKLLGDPLIDIKHYLHLEEIRSQSRKGRHEEKEEKSKFRENEHKEVRRANRKSKKKTYKHKHRKREQRRDSSSGSDSSSEVSKLTLLHYGL